MQKTKSKFAKSTFEYNDLVGIVDALKEASAAIIWESAEEVVEIYLDQKAKKEVRAGDLSFIDGHNKLKN